MGVFYFLFYDVRRMSPDEFKNLKTLFKFVLDNAFSDFYREKYRLAGFSSFEATVSPEVFLKLPYLAKEELVAVPPEQRLYFSSEGFWQLASTSGTSRQKPAFFYIRPEYSSHPGIELLSGRGVKRAMFLNNPARFPNTYHHCERLGLTLIYGDPLNLRGAAYQAKVARIEGLITSPTLALDFAPHLKEMLNPSEIRLIKLSGELVTPLRFSSLRDNYPAAFIESSYGLLETGTLGFQCEVLAREGGLKHHFNPQNYYEITDEGELVVTHLKLNPRFGTPLIRYRTGDFVSLMEENCRCGRPEKLFILQGRGGGDLVKVGGGLIMADEVEKVIGHFPGVKDWLLHVWEVKADEKIKVRLFLEVTEDNVGLPSPQRIAEQFSKIFYVGGHTTLEEAVSRGLFLPLEVKIVSTIARPGFKAGHLESHL